MVRTGLACRKAGRQVRARVWYGMVWYGMVWYGGWWPTWHAVVLFRFAFGEFVLAGVVLLENESYTKGGLIVLILNSRRDFTPST